MNSDLSDTSCVQMVNLCCCCAKTTTEEGPHELNPQRTRFRDKFCWFTYRSVKRPNDILKNSFDVYDLTFLEWEHFQVINNDGKVYLCADRKNSEKKIYHVVYKKKQFVIYSLCRNENKTTLKEIYELLHPILNSLHDSITTNRPKTVSPILKEILESLMQNPKWTCAHIAAKIGIERPFLKRHEDMRKDIDSQFMPDMLTPLHLAILLGKLSLTRTVLNLKPNIELVDSEGNSVLHFAAITDRDILVLILRTPNAKRLLHMNNKKGLSALHWACLAEKSDNVLQFLKSGIMTRHILQISMPVNTHKTQIETNDNSKGDVIKFNRQMIEDMDIEEIKFGGTPLHWTKNKRTMDKLISKKIDVNAVNAKRETALHVMVRKFRIKCLLSLLYNNANVNARDKTGKS